MGVALATRSHRRAVGAARPRAAVRAAARTAASATATRSKIANKTQPPGGVRAQPARPARRGVGGGQTRNVRPPRALALPVAPTASATFRVLVTGQPTRAAGRLAADRFRAARYRDRRARRCITRSSWARRYGGGAARCTTRSEDPPAPAALGLAVCFPGAVIGRAGGGDRRQCGHDRATALRTLSRYRGDRRVRSQQRLRPGAGRGGARRRRWAGRCRPARCRQAARRAARPIATGAPLAGAQPVAIAERPLGPSETTALRVRCDWRPAAIRAGVRVGRSGQMGPAVDRAAPAARNSPRRGA